MNEKNSSHEEVCDQNKRGLGASSPRPRSILQMFSGVSRLQAKGIDKSEENAESSNEEQRHEQTPCGVFGGLVCPGLSSAGLAPLALLTHPGPRSDVIKHGYLGKQGHKHKKYFVLRAGSHSGMSRLEWYKTEQNFTTVEKSAGEKRLFNTHKQGVIFLRSCLGVSLMSSVKKEYKVALFAKDQTLVFEGKDQEEQHEWFIAIKELMEEEQEDGNGDNMDDEDAGYCTLSPASYYKQVWPVNVKLRGLGRSRALAGEILLCLTASALVLVRVGHDLELPSVTLPLLAVRRFGHLDGSFFLELGRSAPYGPGEIWMEPRDEGNSSLPQQIHEIVREEVKALRVIPDFNCSATPNKSGGCPSQDPLALKRSRAKQRLKLVCESANESSPHQALSENLHSPNQSDQSKETEEIISPAAVLDRSPVPERRAEGRGYMLMSPGATHSLHQDEYVAMTSPQRHGSLSFLQSSFSSDTDDHSPQRITEQTPPPWTLYSGQQFSRRPAASSPVSRAVGLKPVSLFSESPTLEAVGPEAEAAPAPAQPRRSRLLSCLPSCLQSKTNK